MPQSIPAGLTQEHVLRTLADMDSGIDHPFGQPTGYELVHQGKRYAPKAVVGLACRFSIGRILQPDEFSGGEAPGQANFVLRKLGFAVIKKVEEEQEAQTGKDWSENEVRLAVTDYFDMLEAELLGKPYKKSDHRKAASRCCRFPDCSSWQPWRDCRSGPGRRSIAAVEAGRKEAWPAARWSAPLSHHTTILITVYMLRCRALAATKPHPSSAATVPLPSPDRPSRPLAPKTAPGAHRQRQGRICV